MSDNIVSSLFLLDDWLKYDQQLISGWLVLKGLQVYHVYNAAQGLMLEILFVIDKEWYKYKKDQYSRSLQLQYLIIIQILQTWFRKLF